MRPYQKYSRQSTWLSVAVFAFGIVILSFIPKPDKEQNTKPAVANIASVENPYYKESVIHYKEPAPANTEIIQSSNKPENNPKQEIVSGNDKVSAAVRANN